MFVCLDGSTVGQRKQQLLFGKVCPFMYIYVYFFRVTVDVSQLYIRACTGVNGCFGVERFATNGGWLGRTLKDVAALCPGADVKPGLDVHFDDTTLRTPDKTIDRWIAAIHD